MKRLVLILGVIVLFSGTIQAADFLDSLRQYHVQILRHLNIDTTSTAFLSTNQTYSLVREGIVAVVPPLRSNKVIRSRTMPFMRDTLTLDSDVVGVLAVQWHKNDSVKSLLPVPKEKWFQLPHQTTVGQQGYLKRPTYYSYIEGFLSVYPVPTNPTSDTIKITAWVKAPNVQSASVFTSVPTQYRVAVLYYAIWHAAQAKSDPQWKDWRDNYFQLVKDLNASLGYPQITGSGVAPQGGTAVEAIAPGNPAN